MKKRYDVGPCYPIQLIVISMLCDVVTYAKIMFELKHVNGTRVLRLGGVVERDACLDLIIEDVPDNLPIPEIFTTVDDVPSWNELLEN